MRELLVSLAQNEKMAILISSHNLAELDNFCNKVCIIKNGEVIETSEIEKIKKDAKTHFEIFEVNNTANIEKLLTNEEIIIVDSKKFKINIEKEHVANVVEKLVNNNIKIYGIKEEEKTLEDAFFERTGGNIID